MWYRKVEINENMYIPMVTRGQLCIQLQKKKVVYNWGGHKLRIKSAAMVHSKSQIRREEESGLTENEDLDSQ